MHISVLLNESIDGLNLREDGIYVDCTLGYAGHSSEILKRIKKGYLFAIDQDRDAIEYSKKKLEEIGSNFTIIKSNFLYLKEELKKREVNFVDGILFDLGVSSVQLDEEERGFSYNKDARLDMRMDQDSNFSAYEVINDYSYEQLIKIFFEYGEEKHAKKIASNIIKKREENKITTTSELSAIINSSVPAKERRDKNPSRKVFQAIRIEVNKELEILEESLVKALSVLNVNGVIVVITFHSLEDRIVKNTFKKYTQIDPKLKGLPNLPNEVLPDFELVIKKVITSTKEELDNNNRARSAKLRIIKRIK